MRFAAAEVNAAFEIPPGVNEREAHGIPPWLTTRVEREGRAPRAASGRAFLHPGDIYFGCPAVAPLNLRVSDT